MTSIRMPPVGTVAYAVKDLSLVSGVWMLHIGSRYVNEGDRGQVVRRDTPDGHVSVKFNGYLGVIALNSPLIIYQSTLEDTWMDLVRWLSEN